MTTAEKRRRGWRLRLSLRALLLWVTVAGVLFGLIGRSLQYRALRARAYAAMVEQYAVTEKIVNRATTVAWQRAHVDANLQQGDFNFAGGSFVGPSDWDEELVLQVSLPHSPRRQMGISVKIEGGFEHLKLRPITIRDHLGLHNRFVIEELVQAYEEANWAYRIVTEPDPLDAAAINQADSGARAKPH